MTIRSATIAATIAVFPVIFAISGARAEGGDPKPLWEVAFATAIDFASEPGTLLEVSGSGGFWKVDGNYLATRTGDARGFLMTFARDGAAPRTIYSSGYGSGDTKLGFLKSEDDGRTWRKISDGGGAPVAFQAIAVSRAAPRTIYGFEGPAGLVVSRDGGTSWRPAGKAPAEIFDLALSPDDPSDLLAATRTGLFRSRDGGTSWSRIHQATAPATTVKILGGGRIMAFVYGLGLIESGDDGANWSVLTGGFQDRALMSLAIDPAGSGKMYATVDSGSVVVSDDGGKSWIGVEGSGDQVPERLTAGQTVYEENCQACHGKKAVGERPDDMYAKDENGQFVAPPLDDSAHGWHHPDSQLTTSIMNGSPRNPRMPAWKESLSAEDVRNVIAYIKSLWSFRSWACQGSRHMRCN